MKSFLKSVLNRSGNKKQEYFHLPGLIFNYSVETDRYNVSLVYTNTWIRKSFLKEMIITLILILLISTGVFSQELVKKSYTATCIKTPPSIDGILNDSIWSKGVWCDDFTQNQPYNGKNASQTTSFKILFDDNNLYVAIKAFDKSPDSIQTRLSRRDDATGDLVGIIIDSYHDLRTGFLFGVSSAGVKFDQIFIDDGQSQDPSWDPDWWVKTSINKEGWVAEMKIPFSQMRFEMNSGNIWGLQIARIIFRKDETDFWQHVPKDVPGFVHVMGELKGLEKIRPRKIFDVIPYGVTKGETYAKDPGNPFLSSGRKFSANAGLDAKIGLTNNLTTDLTINPDFGQVESDPSVINLTAFETFYSEQRPFFIEGSNITSFALGLGDGGIGNDNLFYSRRIGRAPQGSPDLKSASWSYEMPSFSKIISAAKLTGKTQEGLSVGFLDALTAQEYAKVDTGGGRINQVVEPLTNYFVGSIQKDINQGNTLVSGILTGTYRSLDENLSQMMNKSALTGGVGFTQYFKKKSYMFNLNMAFSDVTGTARAITRTQTSPTRYFQRPDNRYIKLDTTRTSLTGTGGKMEFMKLNGHWNFLAAGLWKSPGFEINDIGFLRQADQITYVLYAAYNQWEPKGIYRKYSFNLDINSQFDFGGEWLAKGLDFNASISFKNYWQAWTSGNLYSSGLSTTILRGGPTMKIPGNFNCRFGLGTDFRKKVVFNLSWGINKGFDNSLISRSYNFQADYKPVKYVLVSLVPSLSFAKDQLQYVNTTSFNGVPRYIFSSIDQKTIGMSIRINVNVSPDLTLQYWGQPFIASGRYNNYKYITDPMASRYSARFHLFGGNEVTMLSDGSYGIDENGDGIKPDYTIGRNDFNYQTFLSNLVLRWEYNPGSCLYLVWNQTRTFVDPSTGEMDYFNNLGNLFDKTPHNVFLIKFSYRFQIK